MSETRDLNEADTAIYKSCGGSSLSFQTRAFRGHEVHLNAFPRGLHLTVTSRNDGRVIAAQLIQWDQVAAWMEAARGADHESAADMMSALAFGKLDDAFGDGK